MKKSETLVVTAADVEFYDHADYPEIPADLRVRLREVNGSATAFTTGAKEVLRVAVETEKLLRAQGLPKAKRVGVEVEHRGAGPSAASYRHAAKATLVRLRRRSGGWYLVHAAEDRVHPKQGERCLIRISKAHADAIAAAALRPFTVAAEPPAQETA